MASRAVSPQSYLEHFPIMCLAFRHDDLLDIARSLRLLLRSDEDPSCVALLLCVERRLKFMSDLMFAHHVTSISEIRHSAMTSFSVFSSRQCLVLGKHIDELY